MARPPRSPPPPATPPPPSGPGDRRALVNAYEALVKSEVEREAQARTEMRRPAPRKTLSLAVAVLIIVGGVTVLVLRPAWLFPPGPAPEALVVREASLRLAIYRGAQRIEAYHKSNGRLPATLADLGGLSDLNYTPEGPDQYTLIAHEGPLTLTYHSNESLAEFVGSSYQLIRQRSGK